MRWLLTLYTLLIFSGFTSAQGVNETKGKLDIHIVPLVLFDFNPRLRLGLEYQGPNRLGYSIGLGWANHLFNEFSIFDAVWGNHYSFFEIRPEIKWYGSERMDTYFGAELFYSYHSDRLVLDDYYKKSTGQHIFFEEATFQRNKIGLLLKAGVKWLVWNRISIDYSSGIGLAHRKISYYDQVNPHVNDLALNEEWFTPARKKEGEYILPQVSSQLKFCYLLKKGEL